jgi:hypothetical protein
MATAKVANCNPVLILEICVAWINAGSDTVWCNHQAVPAMSNKSFVSHSVTTGTGKAAGVHSSDTATTLMTTLSPKSKEPKTAVTAAENYKNDISSSRRIRRHSKRVEPRINCEVETYRVDRDNSPIWWRDCTDGQCVHRANRTSRRNRTVLVRTASARSRCNSPGSVPTRCGRW